MKLSDLNPFTILFGVIALPEPAITEDDTAAAPVLCTRNIIPGDFIHDLKALDGHLVQYRHYSSESRTYLGRIVTVELFEKFDTREAYIEPLPGQGVSMVKPYHISTVKLAWYEVRK